MSIKPMLFNTDMVRAILDGKKTVTRRVIPLRLHDKWREYYDWAMDKLEEFTSADIPCSGPTSERESYEIWSPYQPGDIIWVRETWDRYVDARSGKSVYIFKTHDRNRKIIEEVSNEVIKWRPSIHMPKEAARIFLRVTDVRVERLQEITPKEAGNEGVEWETDNSGQFRRVQFAKLWDSTVKPADREKYGWAANPWVWVISFERCERPEGWPG